MILPYGSVQIAFCKLLSQAIFEDTVCKNFPDFLVFAFWLREANIKHYEYEWKSKGFGRVPIGTVFHIPPRNVEVMALYSWIVSLLMGNRNIIRISNRASPEFDHLITLVTNVLDKEEFDWIRESTTFVSYGHDDAMTQRFSEIADVRIVWGGDQTVAHVSEFPMKRGGKQIAFPDRFSFAVIDGSVYASLNLNEKKRIAKDLFNDVFWFDQEGCSSPRLLFWLKESDNNFYSLLQEEIDKHKYTLPTGGVLSKFTYAYTMAIRLPVTKVERYSNELLILHLKKAVEGVRDHCGQGLLYHAPIYDLEDISKFVCKKDQTLSYYGLTSEQIKKLQELIGNRGISRFVPIGQALNFAPEWDGYDLTLELTKEG